VVKWIEEIKLIIYVVSDRSRFGLVSSYEGISGCWWIWDIQFVGVDWQNFIRRYIIFVVSDCSGFGLEMNYEGISGTMVVQEGMEFRYNILTIPFDKSCLNSVDLLSAVYKMICTYTTF
jgi:hypothetical protein